MNSKLFRPLMVIFSLAGIGIMSYLTYIHYSATKSFCDLSEKVSCDVVTTSIYSEIFGIPMSLLGLGFFISVLLLLIFRKLESTCKTIFLLTVFVLIPSLYLSALEILVIKSICVLCESSKILMLAILGISYTAMRTKPNLRLILPVIIAGLVAAGVTFFAQTGTSLKQDYSVFVEDLNQKGVVYYKSVKCNNCRRQEKLFGIAIKKLNSVECHPEGKNPQPQLCLQKKITKTPTFLIEQNGKEVKRLEGLQRLENIAKWADVSFEQK